MTAQLYKFTKIEIFFFSKWVTRDIGYQFSLERRSKLLVNEHVSTGYWGKRARTCWSAHEKKNWGAEKGKSSSLAKMDPEELVSSLHCCDNLLTTKWLGSPRPSDPVQLMSLWFGNFPEQSYMASLSRHAHTPFRPELKWQARYWLCSHDGPLLCLGILWPWVIKPPDTLQTHPIPVHTLACTRDQQVVEELWDFWRSTLGMGFL